MPVLCKRKACKIFGLAFWINSRLLRISLIIAIAVKLNTKKEGKKEKELFVFISLASIIA